MATMVGEVPIGRVEDELVALAGQLSAGTCRWLVLLAEFDRRGGWDGWGINSCVHWLSIRLAISPTTARAQLRVAHALVGLPLVTEQFAAGRLSYSQVRALCRVADATNEAELVRLAREMNADQLERMCRLLRGVDDQTDAEADRSASMVIRWDDDGTATIRVRVPTEDAAAVIAAVDERVKKTDLPRSNGLDARRARALVEVVADGASVTEPARERPLVHITVPLANLDTARGGTVDGHPISDATVRRMLCDGSVVGVVLDGNGNPVSVGTKTRIPAPKIKRGVDVRDGKQCTYPGCGRPADEYHHVVHWVDGHRTAIEIIASLCTRHHRSHHRGEFNIDINPADNLFRFTRPEGTPILTPAATTGSLRQLQAAFPVDAGTVPSRWDGSPLLANELVPPLKEHSEPTSLRFGSHRTAGKTATRVTRTLGAKFQQEGDLWVTSTPELITITPEPAGGSLVTIELTTRPRHLTTTLAAIGLDLVHDTPSNPYADDG